MWRFDVVCYFSAQATGKEITRRRRNPSVYTSLFVLEQKSLTDKTGGQLLRNVHAYVRVYVRVCEAKL